MSDNCGICREELVETKTLKCNHSFHEHCINSWVLISNNCPYCRIKIYSNIELVKLGLSEDKIIDLILNKELTLSDLIELLQSKHLSDIIIKILIYKEIFSYNLVYTLICNNTFNESILKYILVSEFLSKKDLTSLIFKNVFSNNIIIYIIESKLLTKKSICSLIIKKVLSDIVLTKIFSCRIFSCSELNNFIFKRKFNTSTITFLFKNNYINIEYLIDFIRDNIVDSNIIDFFNTGYFSKHKLIYMIKSCNLHTKVATHYLKKDTTEFLVKQITKNKKLTEIMHYIPTGIYKKIIINIQSQITNDDITYLFFNNILTKKDLEQIIDKHDETNYTNSLPYLMSINQKF